MSQKLRIEFTIRNGERCHGCPLLKISNNEDMIASCLLGYWSDDAALDLDMSEDSGELTLIRPQSCIDDNDIE